VYSYSDGLDLLQAQEPQKTYQEISPPLIHICRHRQKQERVNMRSHVSTSRNPLYTNIRSHPHYLTQNSSLF